MKCRKCSCENTKVVDSRVSDHGNSIRRRRECEECGHRFTTFERVQASNLMVEKSDGTTEPYDREKLERGVLVACAKRPVSISKIREKLTELEESWGKEPIVKSKKIGEGVIKILKEIDDIAYIRFASVYRKFRDVETFKEEFEKLLNKG